MGLAVTPSQSKDRSDDTTERREGPGSYLASTRDLDGRSAGARRRARTRRRGLRGSRQRRLACAGPVPAAARRGEGGRARRDRGESAGDRAAAAAGRRRCCLRRLRSSGRGAGRRRGGDRGDSRGGRADGARAAGLAAHDVKWVRVLEDGCVRIKLELEAVGVEANQAVVDVPRVSAERALDARWFTQS